MLLGAFEDMFNYVDLMSGASYVSPVKSDTLDYVTSSSILEENSIVLNYIFIGILDGKWVASISDRLGTSMANFYHGTGLHTDLEPSEFVAKEKFLSVRSVTDVGEEYTNIFFTSGAYLSVKTILDRTPADYPGIDCDNPDVELGEIVNTFHIDTPGIVIGGEFVGGIIESSGLFEDESTIYYAENSVGKSKAFHGRVASILSSRTQDAGTSFIGMTLPRTLTLALSPVQDSYTVYRDLELLDVSIQQSDVVNIRSARNQYVEQGGDIVGGGTGMSARLMTDGMGDAKAYTITFKGYSFFESDGLDSRGLSKSLSRMYNIPGVKFLTDEEGYLDFSTLGITDGDGLDAILDLETEVYTGVDYGSGDYDSAKLNDIPFIISSRLRSGHLVSSQVTTLLNSGATDLGIGKKLVVIGGKFGFILTYVDNISGALLAPTEVDGLEIHMYAAAPNTDHNLTEGDYGVLFKKAVLSPHDNFLYTISEDASSGDQYITVYNLTRLNSEEFFENEIHGEIRSSIVSISNPLSSTITDISLSKDGAIHVYAKGSTEYIVIPTPDLQTSVDTLINLPDILIKELPLPLEGHNNSLVIDTAKISLETGLGVAVSFNSYEEFLLTHSLEWRDPNNHRQLNIITPTPPGAFLPIGDSEEYMYVATNVGREAVNLKDLSLPADVSSFEYYINNKNIDLSVEGARIVSSNGVLVAVVAKINGEEAYTVLNRIGDTLSVIEGEVISVETYTGLDDFHYKIITLDGNVFKSYKLTFGIGCTSFTAPWGMCLGTVVLEGEILTIPESEVIVDTCVINTGLGNRTVIYVYTHIGVTMKLQSFPIVNDISTSTLTEHLSTDLSGTSGTFDGGILKVSEALYALSYTSNNGAPSLATLPTSGSTTVITMSLSELFDSVYGSIASMELAVDIVYVTVADGAGDIRGIRKYKRGQVGFSPLTHLPAGTVISANDIKRNLLDVEDVNAAGLINNILKLPNGHIYIGTNFHSRISRLVNPEDFDAVRIAFGIDLYKGDSLGAYPLLPAKGEFGGIVTDIGEDLGYILPIFGCTYDWCCNFNPLANVNDGSCTTPPFDEGTFGDACDVCMGDYRVTHVDQCGVCHTNGDVTGAGSGAVYLEGTGTQTTACYECPQGTNLGNNTSAAGCQGVTDCVEDLSACTFYGCSDLLTDTTNCNGYGTSGSFVEDGLLLNSGDDLYPSEHLESLCVNPTNACNCDGAGGLTPSYLGAGISNCTDCTNNPDTVISDSNGYCNCDQYTDHLAGNLDQNTITYLQAYGVCDCDGGTGQLDVNCDCGGNFIDNSLCNCAGQNSTEVHGQYCDCAGESNIADFNQQCYDAEGAIICSDTTSLYVLDIDGDGYHASYSSSAICPGDPTLQELNYAGTPMWIPLTESLGVDGCEGFSDECNECIPHGVEGVLTSTPFEMGECGCFDPTVEATEYECACADIPEGYCDCEGNIPFASPNCGCVDGAAAPSYTVEYSPGGISNSCDNTVTFDDCMVSTTEFVVGAVYDEATTIYTLAGNQYCAPGGCSSYASLAPLAFGECCSGYVYDEFVGACVLLGTETDTDCAGVQGGTSTLDACLICNGPNEVVPQCECNNATTFVIGTTTPGDVCDCQGSTVDLCGVCDGNNSTCTGCTDPQAYNHDPTALVEGGNCEYFGITNPEDFTVLDSSVDAVYFSGNPIITHHTGTYSNVNGEDTYTIGYYDLEVGLNDVISELLPIPGEVVYTRDNPYITKRCQNITRLNPTLTLAGADENAEVTFSYSITNPSVNTITGVLGSVSSIDSNTVSTVIGKAVSFYFRVTDELIDNVYIEDVFGSYIGSNIISVTKLDVDTDVIEHGTIEGFVHLAVYQDETTATPQNFYETNYHVYRVLMALDPDGTIAELTQGISFAPYFPDLDSNVTTVYVCTGVCQYEDWGTESNNVMFLLTSGAISQSQAQTLSTGGVVSIVTSVGNLTTAPTSTLYIPDAGVCGACVDPCITSGGYLSVCTDTVAVSFSEILGDCEISDNSVCEYIVPTSYCPNTDYLEFNPEATSDPTYWTPDMSLCQTLIELEDVEGTEDLSGVYTITVEPEGAEANIDYILYTISGTILNTVTASGITTILNSPDCVGFMPIGFNYLNSWVDLTLTLRKGENVLHVLDHGSSTTADGSIVLKTGPGSCSIGCSPLAINTLGCSRDVKEDEGEFTSFTVEVITEESPVSDYSDTAFVIYNVATGEKLVDLSGALTEGASVSEGFTLAESTPIGVKVLSDNMVVYVLKDEYGNTLQTKTVYNSTYFEPFTLNLIKPGCTTIGSFNYDIDALYDDGSCVSTELHNCIENSMTAVNLLKEDTESQLKALKVYAIYQAYVASLKEGNQIKIEMYKEKLADLCNCKTC